jgi:hypothetical protein
MDKSTAVFILAIDRRIRLKITIDPIGDEILEFRSVVSSSTVGALPKLDDGSTQSQRFIPLKRTFFSIRT